MVVKDWRARIGIALFDSNSQIETGSEDVDWLIETKTLKAL